MLATRVIPTMLVRGRQLIKGHQFASWRVVGHAAQAARIHAMRGVDELILLDIGATPEGRGPDLSLVEELSECCFCPLTVGGGIRTVEDVDRLLRAGADKVAINTAICEDIGLLRALSDRYGAQAIVAAVDYRMVNQEDWPAPRPCATASAGKTALMIDNAEKDPAHPVMFAKRFEESGAGEILLTSIDREGTMQGYDIPLIKAVSEAVSIPVVAHGGAGTYQHMLEAVRAGASAVAAGAMFQFKEATPAGAARYLQEHGIEARI